VIRAGVILPSKVTNLIIERPPGFNFSPGDWDFVKILTVDSSEWHPFTISSAHEVSGQFALHIRGVGQWTNSLYKLFEKEYERQKTGNIREVSAFDRIQGTVRKKYHTL
jgi:predicted ferric reductase